MHQNYRYSFFTRLVAPLLLLVAVMAGHAAQATHIRAGDIVAQSMGSPLQYKFTLVIYVDPDQAQQTESTLFFGDGTFQTSPRIVNQFISAGVHRNEYVFTHTYNAPGFYSVSFTGQNRNAGILNMSNSVQTSFYLQTDVFINPLINANQTPRMTVPPLDRAVKGQLFEHNPGAFDIDSERDSLSFKLVVPRMSLSCETCPPNPVPVANYTSPADPVHQGATTTGATPATFTIDAVTGLISWDSPGRPGEYNIAFIVEEWRKVQSGQPRLKVSVTTRDMQIIVEDSPNKPPKLTIPKDLCVIPGTLIQDTISVTDPDVVWIPNPTNPYPVTVQLFSPLPGQQEITFNRIGNTNRYVFRWDVPKCSNIGGQPYQFVFKATDIPGGNITPLVDFATWRIKVVGPPPTNLAAAPNGTGIDLAWDPYSCQNGRRIKIYRRENPFPFIPDSCELGVPAYTGYRFIAEVPITATSFIDTNNGRGLKRCINYSYILAVDFPLPPEGESYASNEAFTELKQTQPVLTKVSVESTDPGNGSIRVHWQPPIEFAPNPTFQYRMSLQRAGAANPGVFSEVYTTMAISADTTFIDTGLNTKDEIYRYRVELQQAPDFSNTFSLLTASDTASTVRLTGTSGNRSIGLAWTYTTPWDSSNQHFIYRQINGVFTLIDSVLVTGASGQYTDQGTYQDMPLEEKKTYCYYVITQGDYRCDTLPQNIFNNSQEICVLLKDITPPCTPILTLEPVDCDNFTLTPPYTNRLKWRLQLGPNCDTTDIAYYTVYFTSSSAAPLDSLSFTTGQFYNHENLVSLAGCYAVSATDSTGNQTPRSNVVCQDNCIFFGLPNIITPNGDNLNDFFRPSPKSRFVKNFSVTIFNRWGSPVYENSKPDTYWSGKDKSGKRVPSGVYYYYAEVEFFTLNPADSKKTFKGWVEVVE